MGKNASKNKGKGYEREVCKIMEGYFGGSWQRTFTSGGFLGGANAWRAKVLSQSQIINNSNDVVPPDEYKNANIECKFYKEFEFHHLFREEGNKTLNSWIDQVWDSGIDMKKGFPLICMKFNRVGSYAVCWKDKIQDLDYVKLQHFNYHYNNNDYVIFELDTFLKTFTEELKKKFA